MTTTTNYPPSSTEDHRKYKSLPLTWKKKAPETIKNDCQWLEAIVANAAPFSDWWVKARIVQLACEDPGLSGDRTGKSQPFSSRQRAARTPHFPTYGSKTSESEIIAALRAECPDLSQYRFFAETVNEEYAIRTLNSWKTKHFTEAISRNFEIYQDTLHTNVFLVVSTAPVSLYVQRLFPPQRFRPLFNVDEFAQIVNANVCDRITLRTHGYGTSGRIFYQNFQAEADALNQDDSQLGKGLDKQHFYIGYHWPSEMPLVSPGLWSDFTKNWGVVLKFAFVLGAFAAILGTLFYGLLSWVAIPLLAAIANLPVIATVGQWFQFSQIAAVGVAGYGIVPIMFIMWVLLMQSLRILVYQRDRYRAIHYGAPDLGEFFWRLDRSLTERSSQSKSPIAVNLVGHSMGGLLLVNTLRILSDRFGKDDRHDRASEIGDRLLLDKLILASPDIPLEFLREGRNNYVRSAIRRCRQIYLMSSDRDIILRYMPTLGNWFSEPSIEMSGYRLGNVYLQPTGDCNPDCLYRPYIRNVFGSQPAAIPTSAYDLFEEFNYIDCSEMKGVNGIRWHLTPRRGLFLDAINTLMFILSLCSSRLFGQLDLHGGYFLTHTPTFKILKLLIGINGASDDRIKAEIQQLIHNTPIRFLPKQRLWTEDSDE